MQFLKSTCAKWQSRRLPDKIPQAQGNAYAESNDAAVLGFRIFYDNRFSRSGTGVACASCHDPEHAFAETKPRSRTISEVTRNAPDLIDAAWYAHSHFWDGKVDNLWSAPLFTFEQADEMGSSRLHVVHVLAAVYGPRYEHIFGALPDLSDATRFPDSGKPGDISFDSMSAADKLTINRIYVNVGKSLEAYMRKLAAGRAPFDDLLAGSTTSMTPGAKRGMLVFQKFQCGACHSGAAFTDEGFHDLGFAPLPQRPADPGRAQGSEFGRRWPFTRASLYADSPAGRPRSDLPPGGDNMRGAFRTPSLRNVSLSPPYGHDGRFATLDQAIDAHTPVLPEHVAPSTVEMGDLVEFLRALAGRPPQRPWSYWPGG